MAIELIPGDCGLSEHPGAPPECAAECRDCEDIPLSIGFARGTASRYETPAFDGLERMPSFGILANDLGACTASSAPPRAPTLSPRPAQLRC